VSFVLLLICELFLPIIRFSFLPFVALCAGSARDLILLQKVKLVQRETLFCFWM